MKVMQGTVKSAKNQKTVTVSVVRKWQHPLYKKYVKRTKSYACHVVDMTLAEGDEVVIRECRPISKTKKFIVVEKVSSAVPELVEAKKPAVKKVAGKGKKASV